MDQNASPPARDESRIDLALSWQMFRKNAKPFLATQGIAFGCLLGFSVLVSVLLSLSGIETSGGGSSGLLTSRDYLVLILQTPSMLIFLAFQGSLYGLAFDVMSSGDQFTELGGTFRYLGKFWPRYLLFGLILNIPTICLAVFSVIFGDIMIETLFGLLLLSTPISFLVFGVFVQAGPALTAQPGIRSAFKDNFLTLRRTPHRLLKTWILFWAIFYLPYFITNIFSLTMLNSLVEGDLVGIPLLVAALITEVWYYFAGVPVQTLIATRIYNSLHLAHHVETPKPSD